VVLLDDDGAVLLLCGSDPAVTDGTAPLWWFTVGGRARPGEPLAHTAVRELAEETGLRADTGRMVGPIWRRESIIHFNGSVMASEEFYFVHQTARFEPSPGGRTELERRYIHGHRWCDAAAIEALVASGQQVYPVQLGDLLIEAAALASGAAAPPGPRSIR
jgi:8-oxo-dGTP pyrophosphatase MutT (NUDIX family)